MQRKPPTVDGAEAHGIDLHYDSFGRLVLVDAQGREHVGVESVRGFPISDVQHWISICDTAGHEVLCIEDLDLLPPPVREVLEKDLTRREFVPTIERIDRVSSDSDPSEWDVQTDRGATHFLLKSDDEVRSIGPTRALIIDSHGIRYLVPDTRALDRASRRILERYL